MADGKSARPAETAERMWYAAILAGAIMRRAKSGIPGESVVRPGTHEPSCGACLPPAARESAARRILSPRRARFLNRLQRRGADPRRANLRPREMSEGR